MARKRSFLLPQPCIEALCYTVNTPLPVFATILCLIALAGLLVAEKRDSSRLRAVCKISASLAFIVVGLTLLLAAPASQYSKWILVGLVLGAMGDVALLSGESRWFLAGLGVFLLGHIAYIVACTCLVPISDWPSLYAAIPLAFAAVALVLLWPHLGSMRGAVVCYIAAIVLMVVGANAVYQAPIESLGDGQKQLLLAGAALFFVSDLSVAISRFVRKRFVDKLWGLPAYYLGQLCIAWTILPS